MGKWFKHTLMAAIGEDGKIRLDKSKCMRCGQLIDYVRWEGQ